MSARSIPAALILALLCAPLAAAAQQPLPQVAERRTLVLQQPGFPTVDSEPVPQSALAAALGASATFVTVNQLLSGTVLATPGLLVLPYGSAFPAALWPAVQKFLQSGGNLLFLGGQPMRVPVQGDAQGTLVPGPAQDSYSQAIGIRHSYVVPSDPSTTHFAWREGYDFLPRLNLKPVKVYAEEGRLNGLAYLNSADGTHTAAPVIVIDSLYAIGAAGARIVALPFTPQPGFWASPDGITLIRTAAQQATAGASAFMLETQYTALRPGESPELTARLRRAPNVPALTGNVHAELLEHGKVLAQATLPLNSTEGSVSLPFRKPLAAGLYTVRATWTPAGSTHPQDFAQNGFVVEDLSALATGPALSVHGDFLQNGGEPFFPVGTNYFTTEENGWDFSGPRNGAVWEHDFADMQRHGVNFVRTGVWNGYGKFIEAQTGSVNERFLRNLEGYLAAAHRHGIAVNFTFFAFSPRTDNTQTKQGGDPEAGTTPPNPYLNQAALTSEQGYIHSVVQRFGKLPFLSYDLINEPSFSNPRNIFHGNVPNGDPAELTAWHAWLQKRYTSLSVLAATWRTTPEQLGSFDHIALPKSADLAYDRYGNAQEVRAFDYNLFAQDMFADWVRKMVATVRAEGSDQLIDVGQDEGGVTNRLLNQFYATAGVSFTTNHTYWQDDALLWDSVAAKRPGMPNITGETGYQPAWDPDGRWRYDELTGSAIEERKWALGFAAGSSGALQWDWAREPDFGTERSDGSAKIWEGMMRDLGAFASAAAPHATGITLPQIAVVLPQSLQLSVFNSQALEAQQTAIRVLYQSNRVEAYAVGEYQTDTLGTPKLIILPSVYGLSDRAWTDIEARVRAGAVLLISGPFTGDEHLHLTDRASALGLTASTEPLQLRDDTLDLPSGSVPLIYGGLKTTTLDRLSLTDGKTWTERTLGKGKVLVSAYPLELNSDLDAVSRVYAYAIQQAGIRRTYTAAQTSPGILICPTRFPHSTLYVLTSETADSTVSFHDERSGKQFQGQLAAGRAALLLVGEHGEVLASYHWNPAS